MKIRFYFAPQQGSGSYADPYRSIIGDFIDTSAGETFNEIDNPARKHSLVSVLATDATHAAIAADSRISLVSRLYDDVQALRDDLDSPISSFPTLFIQGLNTKLEAAGVSTSWASGTNTLRDVIRYMIRVSQISKIAVGEDIDSIFEFLQNNLDNTVSQIPNATRTAVSDWMQTRGVAVGWITNQSTVREIIHFIITNLGIGLINFDGEGF